MKRWLLPLLLVAVLAVIGVLLAQQVAAITRMSLGGSPTPAEPEPPRGRLVAPAPPPRSATPSRPWLPEGFTPAPTPAEVPLALPGGPITGAGGLGESGVEVAPDPMRQPDPGIDRERQPGHARVAAAPRPGRYRMAWEYDTEVVITDEPAEDRRRPAEVRTLAPDGGLVVRYRASAYVDRQGDLHIDAHGSAVEGPWAQQWSPDSFLISGDGRVRALDDHGQWREGWLQR